jgi:isopenicillin-N epimerase
VNNPAGAWLLDPDVTYLNHGSLGACPAPVLDAQSEWRRRLERQPIQFMLRDLQGRLAHVRGVLAEFASCDPDDLALVPNAESCINAVLRSLEFRPGDELLVTTHEYNACLNAVEFVAGRSGATVVRARIPFPVSDAGQVTAAILEKVTPRTRIALVSHVTSATALVFPLDEIVTELEGRGIAVLVDGAHAPGQVELDLDALGASYYAGNCHKWLCGPRGTGFLHVRRDRQAEIHPLVISHGWNDPRPELSMFRKEFDWPGVVDWTGFLAIPTAIEFLSSLDPGGIPGLRRGNHCLAMDAGGALCEVLRTESQAPESMYGSMVSLPIDHLFTDAEARTELEQHLRESKGIEIPILRWREAPDRERFAIRVSCQIYNDRSDIERLAVALTEFLVKREAVRQA